MSDDWGNDPIQTATPTPAASPAQAGDWGNDPVVGAKNYKFSDKAISAAQKRPGTVTVYMSPDKYLALTPDIPSNPRTDKKGASLKKSLDRGDDVDEVPSLDVTVGKDGTAKVVDQDGRHRAQFAKDAGVDLIPVAVQRTGEKGLIKNLAGMKDGTDPVPFDFKPVLPPVAKKPDAQPAPPAAKGAPRWDVLGDIGRAAEGAVSATKEDIHKAFPSQQEREAQDQQNRKDYGLIGGALKGQTVDSVARMGNALKAPLDAAGVALSPITGIAHAGAGSVISYLTAAMPIPGHDPKVDADQLVDQAMLGLAPEGGGSIEGLESINALKSATKADRAAAILKNKAVSRVNERAAADNLTAQDVLDRQKVANESGDKLTLMDMGKKNLRGLAGSVYRAPGKAGADMDTFLEARDKAVSDTLTKDIHKGIAKGSTFNAMKDLFVARTAASKPAFDEAFASGSTAPFEKQFEAHFNDADKAVQTANKTVQQAGNDLTALEAKAATTSDVYAAPTPKELQFARDKLSQAESDMEAANSTKEMVREKLKQAQADKTANAPGAVWTPRLQQFMDNPEVQAGLKKALKLEKQDSVSERRPFKDSDFGIVGTDAEGEPIIGAVPTMKSLAVAKEGLDARVAELKDPQTGRPTKAGLSLKKFRDEFVKELDHINPKYKVARDAWSGPSETINAINEGKQHFSRPESNEEVKADFDALTPSDKEFYRLGAAESKIDSLERTADAGDKTKRVINAERDRKRFRMLFDSDAEAQKFIESVERKRTMFETKNAVKGNSATAARIAEDADNSDAHSAMLNVGHAMAHGAGGNYLAMAGAMLRAKKDLGLINNPELNAEMARLLTDPNLTVNTTPGAALLHNAPLPGVQNQLAKGIFRAAHVNGLRALTMPRPPPPTPPQGQ